MFWVFLLWFTNIIVPNREEETDLQRRTINGKYSFQVELKVGSLLHTEMKYKRNTQLYNFLFFKSSTSEMIKHCLKTTDQPLVATVCLQRKHSFPSCFSWPGLFAVDGDYGSCFLLFLLKTLREEEEIQLELSHSTRGTIPSSSPYRKKINLEKKLANIGSTPQKSRDRQS